MNSYEIVKVRNGYVVHLGWSYNKNGMNWEEVYVFNDYGKMVDKLFELLNEGRTLEHK